MPHSSPRLVLQTALTGLLGLTLSASSMAFAPVSVVTQAYNNARSGTNRSEHTLTPQTVRPATFGKLFTVQMDANVNGQVLYVPHLRIHGTAQNVIYAYTSDNRDYSPCGVYAFNADTGKPLWQVTLPISARFTTPTPVIDLARKLLFVLTKSTNDEGPTFLRAFSLVTGQQTAVIQIQASWPGTGDGSVNGRVYFDGNHGNGFFHADERPGLLLLHGVIYLAFAYNTDHNPYHGWVLGYTLQGNGFHQKYVFCTTPNGSSRTTPGGGDGGIWMDGLGMAVGPKGNLYCSVGNGTFDANAGGQDYGMSYLKLSPELKVLDYFSPHDEARMSAGDLDTGNTGVISLPGTDRLFAGATKFGAGFLMDSQDMGHFTSRADPGHDGIGGVVIRLRGLSSNDNIGQDPICWKAGALDSIFLWPRRSQIEQMVYDTKTKRFLPASVRTINPATHAPYPLAVTHLSQGLTSGGSLGVSSNGSRDGILWAIGYDNVVYALDANNVSHAPYWTSRMDAQRDSIPSVGHFQFSTVANGKLYIPTGSASIAVYGTLRGAAGK